MPRLPGGGGTPYNGLYREAPPERGTFFSLQLYEREGILLVEVYIWRGREICHLGMLKGPKDQTDEFYVFIKSSKRSIFVVDSYLNDNAFTAATGMWKGYHLSIEGIRKKLLFRENMVHYTGQSRLFYTKSFFLIIFIGILLRFPPTQIYGIRSAVLNVGTLLS